MFTRILGQWNTKAKLKIECLQKSFFKEMSFNHSEILYVFITNGKLHTGKWTKNDQINLQCLFIICTL